MKGRKLTGLTNRVLAVTFSLMLSIVLIGAGTENGNGAGAVNETGTETRIGTEAIYEPEPGTEPEPETTESEPGIEPEPGTESEIGTEPEPGTEPEMGTEPEPGIEPEAGTEPEMGIETETGTGTETEIETEAGTEPETGTEMDTEAETEPGTASASEHEPDISVEWLQGSIIYEAGSRGTWNPGTHQYENSIPGRWSYENGGDVIQVKNNGDQDVSLKLIYQPSEQHTEIQGSFADASGNTIQETAIPADASVTVYLRLSGEPASNLYSEIIGNVTYQLAEEE